MLVSITLLSVLDRLQLTFYDIDLINSQLYNIWTLQEFTAFSVPIQRTPAFSAIQSFIWRHTNTAMVLVVVSKLNQRYVFVQGVLELNNASSQHFLERLYSPL